MSFNTTEYETTLPTYVEERWITYLHILLFPVLLLMLIPSCQLFYIIFYGWLHCKSNKNKIPPIKTVISDNSAENTPTKLTPKTNDIELASVATPTATSGDTNVITGAMNGPTNATIDGITNRSTKNRTNTTNAMATQALLFKRASVMPLIQRVLLFISVFLALLYVILQTLFVPWNIGLSRFDNVLVCYILGGRVLSSLFVSARLFLYLFFIYRAYNAHKKSFLEYNTKFIICISISVIVAVLLVVIPLIVLFIDNGRLYISSVNNGINGYKCVGYNVDESKNSGLLELIVHGYGTILDIIFAVISVYLLINRLFKLIKNFTEFSDLFGLNAYQTNRYIMLLTKINILLLIIVISSQLTLVFWLIIPNAQGITYSLDNVINIFSLWLSFKFTDKYYYKYFCGKCCMRIIFPYVKVTSLNNKCCWCCCNNNDNNIQMYNNAKKRN